jgi:hypothetical protein
MFELTRWREMEPIPTTKAMSVVLLHYTSFPDMSSAQGKRKMSHLCRQFHWPPAARATAKLLLQVWTDRQPALRDQRGAPPLRQAARPIYWPLQRRPVKLPALQGKAVAALLLEMTLQVVEVFLLGVRLTVVPLLLVGHLQMVPLQVFALQVVSPRLVPLLVGHLQTVPLQVLFALQVVYLRMVPLPVVPLLMVLHLPEALRLNRDYPVVPRTELSLA